MSERPGLAGCWLAAEPGRLGFGVGSAQVAVGRGSVTPCSASS